MTDSQNKTYQTEFFSYIAQKKDGIARIADQLGVSKEDWVSISYCRVKKSKVYSL